MIQTWRSRYPGLRRLGEAPGPSWNEQDPRVIDRRLVDRPREPRFFTADEFQTVLAIAARIVPQPADRPPIPVAGTGRRQTAPWCIGRLSRERNAARCARRGGLA